ncbi:MAG: tRNA pseudouridine(54/55) synthase Pus10 [Candidatus Bathyarchaeota archaeon]|nr:tRNA pseudouridine(54/55) synthase Pus10 [Candidatus Bathyarchaeota archaeon]
MDVLEKALGMLEKYPLCDHCLGRQFALLGYSLENNRRGEALKLGLTLHASAQASEKNLRGIKSLKVLVTNGFSLAAKNTLHHLKKRLPKTDAPTCFLCNDTFQNVDNLVQQVLEKIRDYEYSTFLMGVELPTAAAEREDEFKAFFNVGYSESIKHEFGRVLGKRIEAEAGKAAEYGKPDIMIIVNPFTQKIKLQVNPLFIAGRYRKLVRDIPQSRWFCSGCRGRGCSKCGGTGLMYPDSVEMLVSKPLLEAAEGEQTSFHASGREDIDARMLGTGRPFVVEVSKPKKRVLDLKALEAKVNAGAVNKVEVSCLRFTTRDVVRKLKKAENAQKEYRALIQFKNEISDADMQLVEENLNSVTIKQQTPTRVMHRRANLTRERYIYKLKVKKIFPKEALMEVRCQGGLYVKELVSSDEGRTVPSVADLLKNPAKILKLDVLKVIMEDQ